MVLLRVTCTAINNVTYLWWAAGRRQAVEKEASCITLFTCKTRFTGVNSRCISGGSSRKATVHSPWENAQQCPVGLYRGLRFLPPKAPPLLIEAQSASQTGLKVSLRAWASQRKAFSLQHVHSCPASGHVWKWMALIPPFLGSYGNVI